MVKPRGAAAVIALLAAVASFASACSSSSWPDVGECVVTSMDDCAMPMDGGAPPSVASLIGYSCSGSARPDQSPTIASGVPRGLICSDRGSADGRQRYCCTKDDTDCAYNPVAPCHEGTYGFQCRGSKRPDTLNTTLTCGQGLRDGKLTEYCCSGSRKTPDCLQYAAAGCAKGLDGWACTGPGTPMEEQLGPNESRADYTYALCGIAIPAPNPTTRYYCCFTPQAIPAGGSCVQHNTVPGCEPGSFGFSCYGPETPEDDYAPMHCKKPGVSGRSAEGYPATLYCCTYE